VTDTSAGWPALSEAVSLVSARVHRISSFGLSGDVPAEDVITALTALCAALLAVHYPGDRGAKFLRDAGAGALHPDDTGETPS